MSTNGDDLEKVEVEKAEEAKPDDKKERKKSKAKKEKKDDPQRFAGEGISFKGKLIGIEPVPEARGDKMCQNAMLKSKGAVKVAGGHKQKIVVNVSLDGLKILDEKSGMILHHHAVHKISFISRDVSDARAFGYVHGLGDGKHDFFAIKTEKPAEGLVLSLRDLFQVVFEMKKREVETQKQKSTSESSGASPATSTEPGSESAKLEDTKEPEPVKIPADASSKASDVATAAEPEAVVGNLLDLESELDFLQQGIAQISSVTEDSGDGSEAAPVSPWATPWATPTPTGTMAAPQFPTDPFQPPPVAYHPGMGMPPGGQMMYQPGMYPGYMMPGGQPMMFPGQPYPGQMPPGQPFPSQPAPADPFNTDPFFVGAPLAPDNTSSSSTATAASTSNPGNPFGDL